MTLPKRGPMSRYNEVIERISPYSICAKSYTKEKRYQDLIADPWTYLILRPLSFYITPLFITIRVSPNIVTFLGFLSLVMGLTFVLLGSLSYVNFIIGSILINLYSLIDAVDGNLARFQDRTSKVGEFFDWLLYISQHIFLPICLGTGLYFFSIKNPMVYFGFIIPNWVWLFLGIIIPFAELLWLLIGIKSRSIRGVKNEIELHNQHKILIMMGRIIVSIETPLFFVAAILNLLSFFLIFYAIFSLLSLIAIIVISLEEIIIAEGK